MNGLPVEPAAVAGQEPVDLPEPGKVILRLTEMEIGRRLVTALPA